jgi:hypothetical protein
MAKARMEIAIPELAILKPLRGECSNLSDRILRGLSLPLKQILFHLHHALGNKIHPHYCMTIAVLPLVWDLSMFAIYSLIGGME